MVRRQTNRGTRRTLVGFGLGIILPLAIVVSAGGSSLGASPALESGVDACALNGNDDCGTGDGPMCGYWYLSSCQCYVFCYWWIE